MKEIKPGKRVWANVQGSPEMLTHEHDPKTGKWTCRYFIKGIPHTMLLTPDEIVFKSPNIKDKPHTITIRDMTKDGKISKITDH